MKTKQVLFTALLTMLLSLSSGLLHAQIVGDTTTLYRIETTDGNEFFGSVVYQDVDAIILKTTLYGDRSNNITFGMGYGYSQGDFNDNPTLSLSFMLRTGPKGYFISENYYIGMGDNPITLLSLGGRSMIKKVGLDYGLVVPISSEMEEFFAIPWLGFTVPFGKIDY